MDRHVRSGQRAIELVGIERSEGCYEARHCLETVIECLIGCGVTIPETFAVETHIPVGERVDKLRDSTCRTGGLVIVECLGDVTHEGVEQREHPAVYLGTLAHGDSLSRGVEAVEVGIESEESVCVI